MLPEGPGGITPLYIREKLISSKRYIYIGTIDAKKLISSKRYVYKGTTEN